MISFNCAIAPNPYLHLINMTHIIEVHGREIIDSRGNPTVEVEVELSVLQHLGFGAFKSAF